MVVSLQDDRSYCRLKLIELGSSPYNLGDLQTEIEVGWSGGLGAANASAKEIHFWESDFKQFLGELRDLERTRRGSARLASLSPDEFFLEIVAVDRLGHIHAQGRLRISSGELPEKLWSSVGFDIDLAPTTLPATIRELERLAE